MDVVLGVSMAPSTVHMVLVEGENGDGVTVDQDDFDVEAPEDRAADRVVAAILGTREGAREGGYQLTSTGVTWSDQAEAAMLRDALIDHKVEKVMLVSAFLAAAALTQTVGNAVGYVRTALLFVEPDTATAAVIESADGSIVDVQRMALADDDTEAVAELTRLVSGMDGSKALPDAVFLVGAEGVDVAAVKPELEAATPLPLSVPEDPQLALARGAALASAHAPLFSSSTQALAWAQVPGTGEVDAPAAGLGYAYVPAEPADYEATVDEDALAYSAVPEDGDSAYVPIPAAEAPAELAELVDSRLLDFNTDEIQQGRKPYLLAGALAALFVVGVVALVIALAVSMRPTAAERPNAAGNVVVPAKQVPVSPPPPTALPPAPRANPVPPQAPPPAPPPAAPAPAPAPAALPPPALPPGPVIPPVIPALPIPGLPGGPPILGPPGHRDGGWGHGGWGHGGGPGGWGHGGGHGRGGGMPIPIPIPGVHLGF